MATAAAAKKVQDFVFEWEGKDRNGKPARISPRTGLPLRSLPSHSNTKS